MHILFTVQSDVSCVLVCVRECMLLKETPGKSLDFFLRLLCAQKQIVKNKTHKLSLHGLHNAAGTITYVHPRIQQQT